MNFIFFETIEKNIMISLSKSAIIRYFGWRPGWRSLADNLAINPPKLPKRNMISHLTATFLEKSKKLLLSLVKSSKTTSYGHDFNDILL